MMDISEGQKKSSKRLENSDTKVTTIKRVINRKVKEYQNLFFQSLKIKSASLSQVDNQKYVLLQQFKNLSKVLKMMNQKNQNKPPFTMHQGFLRWKLKTDYFNTRGVMEKIVLNQNISLNVAIWRMKKVAYVSKYDRSIGKIKKIANLLRKCHEVIKNNNERE